MRVYFGIDCAPGAARPDVWAKEVFEELGVEPVETDSRLFGAWEWHVDVADAFDWDSFSSWMKKKMDRLYEAGHIRGAKWSHS